MKRRALPDDFAARYATLAFGALGKHYAASSGIVARWIAEAEQAGVIVRRKPWRRRSANPARQQPPPAPSAIPRDQFARAMRAMAGVR